MQESSLVLLPPVLAIVIAVWRRNALLALFCGLLLCHLMLSNWQPVSAIVASFTGLVEVFASTSNSYIISFSLLIGALVALMNQSGAVNGFINQLARLNLVKSERQARLLPTLIGTSIFTDTNLSMFTAGMASQQLFDKHKLSRAQLAYLLDSTCAPISILFLINGWGAYVFGLLDGYQFDNTVGILMATISYNLYAIIAVILAYYTAYSGKLYGPMKKVQSLATLSDTEQSKTAPAKIMWLPLFALLGLTFVFLWFSGDGDIRKGSGSYSVFWAVISAFSLLVILVIVHKLLSLKDIAKTSVAGINKMLPAVAILVLSFAFGDAIKALGTGTYVSQLISVEIPLYLLAPIIFIAAAIMAFATGTSWGTFAILIPIAVPIAVDTGLPVEFLVAAVLGGGIFGDHASPISDTTIVASIASGCDHFEHVKTQLPYALVGALLTIILYIFIGLSF